MTNKDIKLKLLNLKLAIHELEARLNRVETDSHPPIFKEKTAEDIDSRLQVLEAFFSNIKKITTDYNGGTD